ncbi:MAG: hypothetical protein JXQ66_01750 [Campylobacterales bacterium]|nr:hypothetical protein [Campylobacterales bacterium]
MGVCEFSYKLGGFAEFLHTHYGLDAAFVFKDKNSNDYITELVWPKYLNSYIKGTSKIHLYSSLKVLTSFF